MRPQGLGGSNPSRSVLISQLPRTAWSVRFEEHRCCRRSRSRPTRTPRIRRRRTGGESLPLRRVPSGPQVYQPVGPSAYLMVPAGGMRTRVRFEEHGRCRRSPSRPTRTPRIRRRRTGGESLPLRRVPSGPAGIQPVGPSANLMVPAGMRTGFDSRSTGVVVDHEVDRREHRGSAAGGPEVNPSRSVDSCLQYRPPRESAWSGFDSRSTGVVVDHQVDRREHRGSAAGGPEVHPPAPYSSSNSREP